jgi:hypothetical protein
MAAPIVVPELQWSDANGKPYAGASLTTYAAGTTSPKSTWTDPGLTALNTNPVVLDGAGRSLMYGDGDYRFILRDIAGNLILDFPATTIVSAAMEPVVSAPTIPDALAMLGVSALISAEASARSAADTAETNARVAGDNAEAAARAAADTILQTNINTEAAQRTNADTILQNQINVITGTPAGGKPVTMQTGTATSGSAGEINVTFPVAYLLRTTDFEVYAGVTYPNAVFDKTTLSGPGSITTAGVVGTLMDHPGGGGGPVALPGQPYTWYATGY